MAREEQQFSFFSDAEYWNSFYKKKNDSIVQESQFSHFVQKFICKDQTIVDLGCGNGRDSRFFNKLGLNVIGIDGSTTAIDLLKKHSCNTLTFIQGNFTNDPRIFNISVDNYYSRFTLHAINETDEDILLNNIAKNLKSGGFFFIEARSINDEKFGKGTLVEKNTFVLDGHHRRFLDMDELLDKLKEAHFVIEYAEEKQDFAPFTNENSPIIRIIARKVS